MLYSHAIKKYAFLFICIFSCPVLFSAQKVHFSVDDVSSSLRQLTEKEDSYCTPFEHPFFKYIKKLHDAYGVSVTLYCFYELDGFSLDKCTEKFADDFRNESGWLKFGYHAFSQSRNFIDGGGYEMFVKQTVRIAGSTESISQTVRLDCFNGSFEECLASSSYIGIDCGIKTLLCADSETRPSYFLTEEQEQELNETEFIYTEEFDFIKTDFRFDDWTNYKNLFGQNKDEAELVVFTHEWILNPPLRRNFILYFFSVCRKWIIERNINDFFTRLSKTDCVYVSEF